MGRPTVTPAGRPERPARPTTSSPQRTADVTAWTDDPATMTADERQAVQQVLTSEYAILMAALGAAWSASLARSSIFLAVVSAAGVALGFAAQGGGVTDTTFTTMALVVLPLVVFLGLTTFVRLVQVQRESMVYLVGMNRIRHFFAAIAPQARPYLVLPVHDDAWSLYRSIGTGMSRRPPPQDLRYHLAQTQGVVGVVTGGVAAVFGALAAAPLGTTAAWLVGAVTFLVVVGGLFTYWQRSLAELRASIRPLFPTPADEIGAPF